MCRFFQKTEWKSIDMVQIVKRSRILIIDDEPFPYVELLKGDGYNIDYWNGNIERIDNLENGYYDLILLDFHGVGTKISEKQGFGILEYVKNKNPVQLVIAMSNKDWGLEYQSFIDLADSKISKTSDYIDFKRAIDILLEKRFSKEYYIELIMSQSTIMQKAEIEKYFLKSLKSKKPAEKLLQKLDPVTIEVVLRITNNALTIYNIINTFSGGC